MELIDKSALVAEINRLIAELAEKGEGTMFEQGRISAFEDAKLFLDTLEVKEVDLEKETKKWWKERLHLNPKNQLWMDAHQSIVFAKHFFELGMAANNKQSDAYIEGVKGSYTTITK